MVALKSVLCTQNTEKNEEHSPDFIECPGKVPNLGKGWRYNSSPGEHQGVVMDYQMKREGHENKSHTMSSGLNHSRTFDEAYTPQPIFCPPPSQETGMLCLSRAFLIGCATTDPFLRILRPCTALRSREEWKLFSLLLSVPGNSTALIMVRRNLKGCSRCLGKQPTLHSPY